VKRCIRTDIGSAKRPDQVPPDGSAVTVDGESAGNPWFFGDDASDMARIRAAAACVPFGACRE